VNAAIFQVYTKDEIVVDVTPVVGRTFLQERWPDGAPGS
jgi:hypothetical protein